MTTLCRKPGRRLGHERAGRSPSVVFSAGLYCRLVIPSRPRFPYRARLSGRIFPGEGRSSSPAGVRPSCSPPSANRPVSETEKVSAIRQPDIYPRQKPEEGEREERDRNHAQRQQAPPINSRPVSFRRSFSLPRSACRETDRVRDTAGSPGQVADKAAGRRTGSIA